MPTPSVRRLISPSRRPIGLVECGLARCEEHSAARPASHGISFEPRNLATADGGTCTHFVEKIRNIGATTGAVRCRQSARPGWVRSKHLCGAVQSGQREWQPSPYPQTRLFGLDDLAP